MNYPNIKGITFRPLKIKGFDRHATSSDGNFWHHNGEKWVKLVPYRTADKKVVVRLEQRGPGQQRRLTVHEVKDL